MILDENQLLTKSGAEELVTRASDFSCECPRHLVAILEKVREFQAYEQGCITTSPRDKETHEWLYMSARNIDQMISATIVQLARLEGMINEHDQFMDHPNRGQLQS